MHGELNVCVWRYGEGNVLIIRRVFVNGNNHCKFYYELSFITLKVIFFIFAGGVYDKANLIIRFK